jgi:hypothetical protein
MTFTLNPDGSGKVEFQIVPMPEWGMASSKRPVATQPNDHLARLLSNAKGVDAWANLSVTTQPNLGPRISGTAYFRDLNALEVQAVQSSFPLQQSQPEISNVPNGSEITGLN